MDGISLAADFKRRLSICTLSTLKIYSLKEENYETKRSAPNRGKIKAAEGETDVAFVRAIRRVDSCSIKIEVVSARDSRAISVSRRTSRRPIVAVDASVPESTSSHGRVNVPAAHEAVHR